MTTPIQADTWLSNPPTWLFFSAQLRAVGRLILDDVQARHFPPDFERLLIQALHQPGKLLGRPVMQGALLGRSELRCWALILLLTAAAASGAQTADLPNLPESFWQRVCAVAAATELLGAALDVIDDLQDGDSPFVQEAGAPLALNTGVALLELVPLALGRARAAGWPAALADAALERLHTSILTSLGGQFLDLQFEQISEVTEEQVMEMTGQKSGTLLALLCRLGAMVGVSENQPMAADYFEAASLFGWHLGVWHQLLNDLHDAEQAQAQTGKSDRRRHKKTLPLLLEQRGMIEGVSEEKERLPLNVQAAFSYTYVVAEIFHLRARKALQTLEEQFGPHPSLWPLLSLNWEEG